MFPLPTRHSPGAVLAGAWAAQASIALVGFGLPAVGFQLRREYGLSLAGLGVALGAHAAGGAVANLGAGLAVDRLGSRLPTLAGGAIAAGGLALAVVSDARPALVVGLFAFGVGSAAVLVSGAGAVFGAYPPERRGWAMGVRQTSVPIGALVGASGLPALAHVFGIGVFFLVGAVVVGLASLAFGVVPEPRAPARRGPRGLALGAIWNAPGLRRVLLFTGLYATVMQALVIYCVPAARAAGFSPLAAGATLVVASATAAVARVFWGRVADRGGGSRRPAALAGAGLVSAAGAALFGLGLHAGATVALVAIAVFAWGAMGWNAVALLSAGELAPTSLVARTVALQGTVIWCIGAGASPLLGVLAERAGWDALWLTAAALSVAGAAAALSGRAPAARRPADVPSSVHTGGG